MAFERILKLLQIALMALLFLPFNHLSAQGCSRTDIVFAADSSAGCPGISTTISSINSEAGVDYYLRNDLNDTIIDGPVTGTGGPVSFNTGPLFFSTTFNIVADTGLAGDSGLDFDGIDNFISAGNVPFAPTDSFTIEARILYRTPTDNYPTIIEFAPRVGIKGDNGSAAIVVNNGTYSVAPLTNGQWYHLAAVRRNGTWEFYIDGVPQTFNQPPAPSVAVIDFYIGGRGTGESFNGVIDEVRVWTVARTAQEIMANKDSCLTGNETGLYAYYNFQEGTGTTVTDLSGNGYHQSMWSSPSFQPTWTTGTGIVCTQCVQEMTTTVTVNVHPAYNQPVADTICHGGSYTFPDGSTQNNITAQVIQTSNLSTIEGCDSVIVTTLDLHSTYSQAVADTICSGDSYTFPDSSTQSNITAQVIQTSNLSTIEGCDSVIITTLDLHPTYSQAVADTICSGESYTFPDSSMQSNITAQVIQTSTLSTMAGCDSIIVTTVDVLTTDTSIVNAGNMLTANATNASFQWLDCNNGLAALPGETNAAFSPAASGSFAVEVTQNGCTDTSACHTVTVIRIDPGALDNAIEVYPNPTTGSLWLQLAPALGSANARIVDAMGKLVFDAPIRNEGPVKIVLPAPRGVYFLSVSFGDQHRTFRIVKM